jgi:membrane associated rhomboid family serine protease
VLGAYLILHPRNPVRVLVIRSLVIMPAWFVLGLWIVMQVLSHVNEAFTGGHSGVAYMAHIGGFAVGFVVSFVMRTRARRRPRPFFHSR